MRFSVNALLALQFEFQQFQTSQNISIEKHFVREKSRLRETKKKQYLNKNLETKKTQYLGKSK